jgi:DNA repair protein RecO (recombination protein O)
MGYGPAPDHEIAEGFRTTGHFLREHLAPALGNKPLPEARARFVDGFNRRIGAP